MFIKKEGIDYLSNFYRSALYDKKNKIYLLTTDDGNFLFVNSSALRQLRTGKIIDENIYNIFLSKNIIVNQNNFNRIVQKTTKRYGFLANGTSLHIVIPTHRCNLGCTYCFASATKIEDSKDENDLDEKTAKRIVEFILTSPSNAITIEFQGGEATARFDTVKLMSLYEEIALWLIENDITICTSFDGPKIVHDKNRFINAKNGIEIGTYDKVVHWINRINQIYEDKKKPYKVNALMTVTKHSLPYYKEIIDEYRLKTREYQNVIQNLEKEIDSLHLQISNLKRDLKIYIEETSIAKNRITNLAKEEQYFQDKINKLKTKVESYRHQSDSWNMRTLEKEATYKNHEQEIKKIGEVLETKQATINQLHTEILQYEQERQALMTRIDVATKHLKTLEEHKTSLVKRIEKYKKTLNHGIAKKYIDDVKEMYIDNITDIISTSNNETNFETFDKKVKKAS